MTNLDQTVVANGQFEAKINHGNFFVHLADRKSNYLGKKNLRKFWLSYTITIALNFGLYSLNKSINSLFKIDLLYNVRLLHAS
jgi:hypothetical protein